jgi:hypothetical protein
VGTVAAGGTILLLRERLPEQLWFPLGMIAVGQLLIAVALLEERRQIHDRELYSIMLLHKDKKISVRGLRDTGNQLMDPYVHEPVHILAGNEAGSLQLDPKKCRLIPCATVGDPHGLLQVWTIDGMEWESHGRRKRRSPVQIGVGEEVLFRGKDYRLILAAGFDLL